MIEQVLDEIRLAEEKAEAIRKKADEEAAALAKKGEEEAAELLKEAEEKVKTLKREYKVQTNDKVKALYEEILKNAEEDAEVLFNSLQAKIEILSDEVTKKVLNGNC